MNYDLRITNYENEVSLNKKDVKGGPPNDERPAAVSRTNSDESAQPAKMPALKPAEVFAGFLRSMGVQVNPENLRLPEFIVKNQIPLTEANFRQLYQSVKLFGGDFGKASFMFLNDIQPSTANAASVNGFIAQNAVTLLNQLQSLSQQLEALPPHIKEAVSALIDKYSPSAGTTPNAPPVANTPPQGAVSAQPHSGTAEQTQTAQPLPQSPQSPQSPQPAISAPTAETQAAPQTPTQLATAQPTQQNPSAQPPHIILSNTPAAPPQESAAPPLPAAPATEPQQGAAHTNPPTSAPATSEASPPEQITQQTNHQPIAGNTLLSSGAPVSALPSAPVSEGIPVPPASESALTSPTANQPAAEPRPQAEPLSQNQPAAHDQTPSRTQPPSTSDNSLSDKLLSRFSLHISELTQDRPNADKIDASANRLRAVLQEISSYIRQQNAQTPETREIFANIDRQSAFIAQIRHCSYIQFPLTTSDGSQINAELYVFRDRRQSGKKPKGGGSALIALDLVNLGRLETYVRKTDNNIDCQFRAAENSALEYVKLHIPALQTALRESGYTLSGLFYKSIDQPFTVIDEEPAMGGAFDNTDLNYGLDEWG
jgi:chemotaxis protein histidine kinase CheA